MSAATDRINAVVPRVLPLVVGVIVVSAGYYWLLQSGIADYRRIRVEAQTLESRVRILEETVARGREMTQPDQADALRLFEQRVSSQDRVTDVVERLTSAVAESATDGKLRNLAIVTGDQAPTGSSGQVRPDAAGEVEAIDPRWSLFPYSLTHTSVTLSFDASYGTIASFFSKVRDLPTAIEIRSVKLTRGLPLMSVEMTVVAFRRGVFQPDAGAVVPLQLAPGGPRLSEPERPPANSLTPRIVEPRGPGG